MKVLVSILTSSCTQARADSCIDTWVKDIKDPHEYIFYGDKLQSLNLSNTINCSPDSGESRPRLPEKTLKMLRSSLRYDWDFLFKCDDDTYLHFDKLVKYLKNFDSSHSLYIGSKIFNHGIKYAQGGAGYILTRSSVIKCINSLEKFFSNPKETKIAEDYSVGKALHVEGIELQECNELVCPSPKNVKIDSTIPAKHIIESGKISSHYVTPETMRFIYNTMQ